MSHQRTNIRNALKSILLGNTSALANVFTNRTHNINKYPSIVIYDDQESAVPRDIQGKQSNRTLTCKLELSIEASSNYDATLDDLVKQVEDLISANRSISGTATSSTYLNTELDFEQGQKPLGKAVLTYEIKYTY